MGYYLTEEIAISFAMCGISQLRNKFPGHFATPLEYVI